MKYIVSINAPLFYDIDIGVLTTFYIQHIFSYKKKRSGIVLTMNIEHTHKYCSEITARKAAEAYNGEVVII